MLTHFICLFISSEANNNSLRDFQYDDVDIVCFWGDSVSTRVADDVIYSVMYLFMQVHKERR